MMMLKEDIKYSYPVVYAIIFRLSKLKRRLLYDWRTDASYVSKLFFRTQGYKLDLSNPETLNEKIQWLKIYDREKFHTTCADKYRSREYLRRHFAEEYFVPILFMTRDYKEIRSELLPQEPFVIKTNHDGGHYVIVRSKADVDWEKRRLDFKFWMKQNYYYNEREWQYRNISPCIIAEKLLLNSEGRIPNDYKIHCINGEPEFIYVSFDREGENTRQIFDINWEPLNFTWARKKDSEMHASASEILRPLSLPKMLEFSRIIAKDFPHYVRVDFYDVDGRLYFGEITQHHGGGFDVIRPFSFDKLYGRKISLPIDNAGSI